MSIDHDVVPDGTEAPGEAPTPRVLVVHRSAMRALFTEHVLTKAGFTVRTLTDPRALAPAVAAFEPDLILTAEPVAETSGLNLAAVARTGDTARLIPVVMGAVDHRREPRPAPAGQESGADDLILSRERLLDTMTRRIADLRGLSGSLIPYDRLDPDTGLATRRHFMAALKAALAEPDIGARGDGLLIVALDGAAELNHQWGTGTADLAADQVGRVIAQGLAGTDLAARLDDHRYAVLVRCAADQGPWALAQTLLCAVTDTPCTVRGTSVPLSVSIGIGPFAPPVADTVTLIRRAERACAEAAASGGNAVVLDQPGVAGGSDDPEERRISRLIGWALTESRPVPAETPLAAGLRLIYQPVVAVRRQVLHLVEAILCLTDECGTLMQPAEFLPLAGRSGRRAELDRWLLVHAMEVLGQEGQAQPRLRLFVRQQAEGLTPDPRLTWLAEEIAVRGLGARAPILDFEVQDLFVHRHLAAGLASALRKCGVQVSLSGVDPTPAALDLVREMAPSYVRLAPAVNELRADRLHHLIHRISQGGVQVIACGVDTHALIAPVWASGVGYAQGAAIHAPRPQLDFDWDEVVTAQAD